jgi:hypothetical protein
MFLFFLCLGTTPAPVSCLASCRPNSSPPHLIWVRRGSAVPLLQPLYDGPYSAIHRGSRSFTLQVRSRDEIVAISRLKACTAADAAPGSPRSRGRPPGRRPGGSAAVKRVSFAHPLASTPSIAALPQNGPGTVFLPSAEVFARPRRAAPSPPPQQWNPPRQRTPPRNPLLQRTPPRHPQCQRTPPQRMNL